MVSCCRLQNILALKSFIFFQNHFGGGAAIQVWQADFGFSVLPKDSWACGAGRRRASNCQPSDEWSHSRHKIWKWTWFLKQHCLVWLTVLLLALWCPQFMEPEVNVLFRFSRWCQTKQMTAGASVTVSMVRNQFQKHSLSHLRSWTVDGTMCVSWIYIWSIRSDLTAEGEDVPR